MTGKDLIIFILQNNLENAPVFEDGRFIGFITEIEAAIKFNVGTATIRTWVDTNMLYGIKINNMIYIPANEEDPRLKGDIYAKNDKKTNTGSIVKCDISIG